MDTCDSVILAKYYQNNMREVVSHMSFAYVIVASVNDNHWRRTNTMTCSKGGIQSITGYNVPVQVLYKYLVVDYEYYR